ncbi:MAG: glycerol kinase, partial [Alphaproteobacteria bacterium]|nr:glycerol kinase [Alphaproteobacteria bacterium]
MENRLILVIDAGTTSTRAMIFTQAGRCLAMAQEDIDQHYPQPGWVEHDATQIWDRTLACIRAVVGQVDDPGLLCAIGITNQRETLIFWDRRTGAPLAPAIVWQDRRT